MIEIGKTLMLRKLLLCALLLFALYAVAGGLTLTDTNHLELNGIGFSLDLSAEQRTGHFAYQPISFAVESQTGADNISILYSSAEMDLQLTLTPQTGLNATAWQAKASAQFKTDLLLRQLYFTLNFDDPYSIRTLKGSKAINAGDEALNINITPYSDKAIAYTDGGNTFWIVASNYSGCSGVEALSTNQILLYDFSLHYFMQYRTGQSQSYFPRDAMPQEAGNSFTWSWLIFESAPVLPEINRWPAGKKAALAITTDANGQSLHNMKALYLGSNTPGNANYGKKGIIHHDLKISNCIFGIDRPALRNMLDILRDHGNSIGYNTYKNTEDPLGANAQALLHDLAPYNVRLWTDYSVSNNPECLGYNGLEPDSLNYVGDVINESDICYAWMNDRAQTNPFNAYDDPWRLPHRLYEMSSLSKPVWFFGRTRALTWEYLNGNISLDMKHMMTAENLDKLIQDNGLHVSYTYFYLASVSERNGYYLINNSGDYEIRPEVEEMFAMLAYYRNYRGLWMDTVENIFDRMLAIEQVKVLSVQAAQKGDVKLFLANDSDYTLADFEFKYQEREYRISHFPAHSTQEVLLRKDPQTPIPPEPAEYCLNYLDQVLYLSNRKEEPMFLSEVCIYNLKGQKVKQISSPGVSPKLSIPFAGFASGVYFARIKAAGEPPVALKFGVLK